MNRRTTSFVAFVTCFFAPMVAMAAPAATGGPNDGTYAIAMGFGMGIAALGCALGQGRAAAAALEGICRNPNAAEKVNTPMLLALAFVESLTIFTLVTAFLIYGKFGI